MKIDTSQDDENGAFTAAPNDPTVHRGETAHSCPLTVSVLKRTRLGKQLTICHCVVEPQLGVPTSLSAHSHIDVVCRGDSLAPFTAAAEGSRHRIDRFIVEANRSKPGRIVIRVLDYGVPLDYLHESQYQHQHQHRRRRRRRLRRRRYQRGHQSPCAPRCWRPS